MYQIYNITIHIFDTYNINILYMLSDVFLDI